MTFPKPWLSKINISEAWSSDHLEFPEHRDAIVEAVRSSEIFFGDDDDLNDILFELEESEDYDEFNEAWNWFYDWCDENRVWVNIHG